MELPQGRPFPVVQPKLAHTLYFFLPGQLELGMVQPSTGLRNYILTLNGGTLLVSLMALETAPRPCLPQTLGHSPPRSGD